MTGLPALARGRAPRRAARGALWAVLILAAMATAGCARGPTTEEGLQEGAAAGELRGVVFDPAIRPIERVSVSIPGRPDVTSALTDAAGAFVLTGVLPGTVFVSAEKPGYLSAHVQAHVLAAGSDSLQILLEPLQETQPYLVLESFRGFMDCGVGSTPVFGLTAGCMVVLGSALHIACHGGDPLPPTGICLDATDPYFVSTAQGNLTMAQTEAVWEPTVQGQSELLIGSYVLDPDGVVVGGAPSATGHSVLVRRINETVVKDAGLGGENRLAIFMNPGNAGAANVVLQQGYTVFHSSAFHFTFPEGWVFAVDGAPPVPGQCTTC